MLRLGEIAVELGHATPEQVEACIQEQATLSPCPPLGQLLESRGVLSPSQLQEVLREQARRLTAMRPPLGRIAVKWGGVDSTVVARALEEQARGRMAGREAPLGELLVGAGALTRDHLERLLALQQALTRGVSVVEVEDEETQEFDLQDLSAFAEDFDPAGGGATTRP